VNIKMYVHRDEDNNIKGLSYFPDGSTEEITEDDPECIAFRRKMEPVIVSMAQCRKAFVMSGTTIADVDAAISQIEDPQERELATIDWQYGTEVNRDSAYVIAVCNILGMSDSGADELFSLAQTL